MWVTMSHARLSGVSLETIQNPQNKARWYKSLFHKEIKQGMLFMAHMAHCTTYDLGGYALKVNPSGLAPCIFDPLRLVLKNDDVPMPWNPYETAFMAIPKYLVFSCLF